jgi:hypothetical protein
LTQLVLNQSNTADTFQKEALLFQEPTQRNSQLDHTKFHVP